MTKMTLLDELQLLWNMHVTYYEQEIKYGVKKADIKDLHTLGLLWDICQDNNISYESDYENNTFTINNAFIITDTRIKNEN